ncbi:MAG: M20 family metallopeptidase [Caldilineaceae bacterium]
MLKQAQAIANQLVAWRRQIHSHPELSFQEQGTARLVAETLETFGVEVQTGIAKTGVVGYLGEGSPIIGIRADMDALPIQEVNNVPYKSQVAGVMHACGHDAHTAMLLGVAKLLSEMPNRPPGQIRFLFQPSEEAHDSENKSGGERMVEEGVLNELDAVIALHVASDMPVNKIMLGSGYITANEDSFEIVLRGTGGHGAFPHQTIDPVFILAQVLNAINGIRARRIDPTRAAALSIGSIHAGVASNVIPSEVKITGTMRSFDDEVRQQLKDELVSVLGVAKALGGDFDVTFISGYPSTYNDPNVVNLMNEGIEALVGKEAILPSTPMMGAEDFSYMSRKAPGAMFMLGAAVGDKSRPHHTPVFDIDEACLPTGTAILADTAVKLLKEKAS